MSRAPAPPEGFPEKMWLYHHFRDSDGWNPRIVDELDLEEAYWLPIMKDAQNLARAQLAPDD